MDVSENQRSGLNAALRTLRHRYPVVLEKKNQQNQTYFNT